MKINLFFGLFVLLILAGSCSSKLTQLSEFEGGKLEINEFKFTYFQGKTKINFKDEETDIKAKANIRISKDSLIWMSFSAAGISGGKCLIDKDSITIINQIKNEYYTYGYKELSKRFNFQVTYEIIEAAAMGNLLLKRNETDRATQKDNQFILRQKSGNIQIENYVNSHSHKINKMYLSDSDSENNVNVEYDNFESINEQYFPFTGIISLFYKTDNSTFNTTIEFEYSKAEISDKPLKFPFRIPKKYVER